MTRGTLAIISDDNKMFQSIEFNGDMYLSGYGIDAIKCLETVDTEDDFEDPVDSCGSDTDNPVLGRYRNRCFLHMGSGPNWRSFYYDRPFELWVWTGIIL